MSRKFDILPSGLPLCVDDAMNESPNDGGASRSIMVEDCIPLISLPERDFSLTRYPFETMAMMDVGACHQSFQVKDVLEGNGFLRFPSWSKDLVLPIARTHIECRTSEHIVIEAVWSFLKEFPTCIHEFFENDFQWNCSLLSDFETISFTIRLYNNLDNNTILVEYRRTSGSCYVFQDIFRSFQDHIRHTYTDVSVTSNFPSLCPEMKRRRDVRSMPLINAPEVSAVELISSIVSLQEWFGSSHLSAPIDTSQPLVQDFQSLSEGIRVGALLIHSSMQSDHSERCTGALDSLMKTVMDETNQLVQNPFCPSTLCPHPHMLQVLTSLPALACK